MEGWVDLGYPQCNGGESNSQAVDHKSDALTTTAIKFASSRHEVRTAADVLFAAEQRQANESLVTVNAVLKLSRTVVNQSTTLQAKLETIEAAALSALQRTQQQDSAGRELRTVNFLIDSRSCACCHFHLRPCLLRCSHVKTKNNEITLISVKN